MAFKLTLGAVLLMLLCAATFVAAASAATVEQCDGSCTAAGCR